ncbi:hypothetical protein KUTeg_023509 [Tegillarca granosa]|uniref:Uncharacterized protein n=1 Tax=Tegillarca granosa TaxID=220873 RepID=A0ABQ9E1V8_TEGGR|nr:hypothetical protein KUTeg_023509 [Tegillarca granosa]
MVDNTADVALEDTEKRSDNDAAVNLEEREDDEKRELSDDVDLDSLVDSKDETPEIEKRDTEDDVDLDSLVDSKDETPEIEKRDTAERSFDFEDLEDEEDITE